MIIVDASALGTLLVPDEAGDDSIAEAIATGGCAPPHLRIELASLTLKAIRRGRIAREDADLAFAKAEALAGLITLAPFPIGPVVRIAEQHGLSAYDAAYLWLSIDRKQPLLTIDGPLLRVAQKLGLSA